MQWSTSAETRLLPGSVNSPALSPAHSTFSLISATLSILLDIDARESRMLSIMRLPDGRIRSLLNCLTAVVCAAALIALICKYAIYGKSYGTTLFSHADISQTIKTLRNVMPSSNEVDGLMTLSPMYLIFNGIPTAVCYEAIPQQRPATASESSLSPAIRQLVSFSGRLHAKSIAKPKSAPTTSSCRPRLQSMPI